MAVLFAGIDAGKMHHHCVVIDQTGNRLLSRRVANDEAVLLDLIAEILNAADGQEVLWATDLNHGGSALLIGLLTNHDQTMVYIPGRIIHHAAKTYRGDGKTDAKDAAIIADQARMRSDLSPVRVGDPISTDLRMLGAYRTDLVHDRTRAFNRLRAVLLNYFPALEAAFDYAHSMGGLRLLTKYQTPDGIRKAGEKRITAWLAKHKTRTAALIAERAVSAANTQHTTLPAQRIGAVLVARIAENIMVLHTQIADIDRQIEARFREHEQAETLLSMPGFGPLLSAEFLAAIGGNTRNFKSASQLAGFAGLAPAPKDSGRISGNLHRPQRYDRRLLRACYLAAQTASFKCSISRQFYQRKISEGKSHKQAVLALARRRLNVLYAMLRDNQAFNASSTTGLTKAA